MLNLIKKYILPKETDFITGLQQHANIVQAIIDDLLLCFSQKNESSCQAILNDEHQAQSIREKNMNELLNTFITPFDRESIYRVISQLDWVALSIRHFLLEAKAYKINQLEAGQSEIIQHLQKAMNDLCAGFNQLNNTDASLVAQKAQDVRNGYETIIEIHIHNMAELANNTDTKEIFIQKELFMQLKEIAKRLHVCANSLEDIVIKKA